MLLNRTLSNWNFEEREKINQNWDIIEGYLSRLQNKLNLISGDVDVEALIGQINDILNQSNVVISDLQTALQDANTVISNAQESTDNANAAAQSALNAINDIQNFIDSINFKGEYSPSENYEKNNIVRYGKNSYVSLTTQNGVNPNDDGINWRLLAVGGIDGSGAVSTVNGIEPDENGNIQLNYVTDTEFNQFKQNLEDEINNVVIKAENYGVLGDGVTDNTIAIQNMLDELEDGTSVILSRGTYVLTGVKIRKSINFISYEGATFKFADSLPANTVMFDIVKNGINVSFNRVKFDANKQGQTAPSPTNRVYYYLIRWNVNDDTPKKSKLSTIQCEFLNVASNAMFLVGSYDSVYSGVEYRLNVDIDRCYFEKGFENTPGSIDISMITASSNINLSVTNSEFIKNEPVTQYGLTAILLTTGSTDNEVFGTATIKNNYFKGYGRQGATGLGGLGVLEFYASSEKLFISGNRFEQSFNSSIRGKVNSKEVVITENFIDGFLRNANSEGYSYGIEIQRGTYFSNYDSFIISNNIIKNVKGNGISISGSSFNLSPPQKAKDIIISNNIVQGILENAVASNGIYLSNLENAIVESNIIRNFNRGIFASNLKLDLIVDSNQIIDTTQYSLIVQSYVTNEPGYPNYDGDVTVTDNKMRTSIIPENQDLYRFIYFENVDNVLVNGNLMKNSSSKAAQNCIRTGANVDNVLAIGNVGDGSISNFRVTTSATYNGMLNYLNKVADN